jgi:hypothetical protein
LYNLALFCVKNANFFAIFFCEIFLNHNIGPWFWVVPASEVAQQVGHGQSDPDYVQHQPLKVEPEIKETKKWKIILRAILNFTPGPPRWISPLGVNMAPRGEICPVGA